MARIEAAATALRSFIQFKDGAILQPLKPSLNLDFTSDEHLENGTSKPSLDSSKSKEFLSNLGYAELVELVDKYVAHVKSIQKYSLDWNFGMASKYSDFYFFYNLFHIFHQQKNYFLEITMFFRKNKNNKNFIF